MASAWSIRPAMTAQSRIVMPIRAGVGFRVTGEADLCFDCGPDGSVYHPGSATFAELEERWPHVAMLQDPTTADLTAFDAEMRERFGRTRRRLPVRPSQNRRPSGSLPRRAFLCAETPGRERVPRTRGCDLPAFLPRTAIPPRPARRRTRGHAATPVPNGPCRRKPTIRDGRHTVTRGAALHPGARGPGVDRDGAEGRGGPRHARN